MHIIRLFVDLFVAAVTAAGVISCLLGVTTLKTDRRLGLAYVIVGTAVTLTGVVLGAVVSIFKWAGWWPPHSFDLSQHLATEMDELDDALHRRRRELDQVYRLATFHADTAWYRRPPEIIVDVDETPVPKPKRQRKPTPAHVDQELKETDTRASACAVCRVNKIASVLSPCQHATMCWGCAQTVTTCPKCRNAFTKRAVLYYD